jgi:hypothetical protein
MRVLRKEYEGKFVERKLDDKEEYRVELFQKPAEGKGDDDGLYIVYHIETCCERDAVKKAKRLYWINDNHSPYPKKRRKDVDVASISSSNTEEEA